MPVLENLDEIEAEAEETLDLEEAVYLDAPPEDSSLPPPPRPPALSVPPRSSPLPPPIPRESQPPEQGGWRSAPTPGHGSEPPSIRPSAPPGAVIRASAPAPSVPPASTETVAAERRRRQRRMSVAPPGVSWASPPEPEEPAALEARGKEHLSAGRPQRAREVLRAVLRTEPWRVDAARAFLTASEQLGDTAGGHLASSYLSLVDPKLERRGAFPSPEADDLDMLLHDSVWAPVRQLWHHLWTEAGPIFRETGEAPPNPNERVTRIATTNEARAFNDALHALGRQDLPPFYFRRQSFDVLRVVRHLPPCLVAGRRLAGPDAEVRFQIGYGLEALAPDHILVATLSDERLNTLVEAVQAAFGPADDSHEVSRAAAGLAAELWRTMPTRAQNEMRAILDSTVRWSDLAGFRKEVSRARLRSGLIASGDLAAAARGLLRRARREPIDDLSLSEAVAASDDLREVLSFAFGPLLA